MSTARETMKTRVMEIRGQWTLPRATWENLDDNASHVAMVVVANLAEDDRGMFEIRGVELIEQLIESNDLDQDEVDAEGIEYALAKDFLRYKLFGELDGRENCDMAEIIALDEIIADLSHYIADVVKEELSK